MTPQTEKPFEQEMRDALRDAVLARLKALGINKVQLAAEVKAHPAFISKVLNGRENLTIRTIIKISNAVGLKPSLSFTTIKL